MTLTKTASLLSVLLLARIAQTVIVWKTVLLSTKSSTKNIKTELFDRYGLTSATPPTSSVLSIAGKPEYRSGLIDSWATENHTEVRLAVFNKHGDILWHLTLDGFGSDLTNWDRPSRAESSTDKTVATNIDSLDIRFDDKGLNVTKTGDSSGWLWIDYNDAGNPQIYFTTKGINPFPSDFTPVPNPVAVSGVNPTESITFGEDNFFRWTVGMPEARYVIGFSVTAMGSNRLTQFKLAYSFTPQCLNAYPEGYILYKQDNGTERVFHPEYSNNEAAFDMVTLFAQCVTVTKVKTQTTGDVGFTMNIWTTKEDYLEGEMFGIQWGVADEDPLQAALDEIKQQIALDKYGTALYRSQFTSAVDTRGSAVVFGVAGIIVFLAVILGIVLLDLSTLSQHTRFMKRNLRHFRETVRKFLQKRREKRQKRIHRKAQLIDIKQVKVKVTGGGAAGTGTGSAGSVSKSASVKTEIPASSKAAEKSGFKKSVKNVLNVKKATSKKTPALLSKISE